MRLAAVLLLLAAATPAFAVPKPQGPMQTCTAQWIAMRQAGDLHGQNYNSFIRLCLQGKTVGWGPVTAKSPPRTRSAEVHTLAAKPVKSSGGNGNRMKMCGAKWQALKATNATNGQTWRQFSSQCLRKP